MSELRTIDAEYLAPDLAACYLRVEDGEAAFVETATAQALPQQLAALDRAGLAPEQVRWIVVTHVHLDHAGGASALLAKCPNATLVAHPRAARHLIDPEKLVKSARAVYGEERFAELYGTVAPIPASRVRIAEDGDHVELGRARFTFLHTRGHANHHFVVHDPARDTVFTGDTFGLVYPRLQRAGRFAFPSTSPTDFDGAAALESVDKVLSLNTKSVCPTHFGEVPGPAEVAEQLRRWLELSSALCERAKAIPDDGAAYAEVRAALERRFADEASAIGLTLDAEDRAFLELDIDLNAQGLVAAARRTAKA